MTNAHVAKILDEIALLLRLSGENPFKIRSYESVARMLEGTTEPLESLLATARLRELDGIGGALEEKVAEFVATGRIEYLERLRLRFPEEVIELLRVPGLGPNRVKFLHESCGISSLERLRHACEIGELARVKGFGRASQDEVLRGVELVEQQRGLVRAAVAMGAATVLLEWLATSPDVKRVEIAGSLRRRREVVRNINLVALGEPAAVLDRFLAFPELGSVVRKNGASAFIVLANGIPAGLHVVPAAEWAFALAHFTGSRAHNAVLRQKASGMGLRLSARGLTERGASFECPDESALYSALGMPFIPPELRENAGEFDAAFFPALVDAADIRGIVHCHSTWSDGNNSLEELAEAAAGLGYDYLVVTDHSRTSTAANGMDIDRIHRQQAEIRSINDRCPRFRLVQGIEADILPDGSLDMQDELPASVEVVIASVHHGMDMTEEGATRRVIRALENPRTMILGHATGRMLLQRPGYPLDMDRVIDAAVANGVALEINVNPGRLDLDWRHMRQARDKGAKFVIGPDSHRIRGLNNIPYGVGVARKGWLRRGDILNCQPWEAFLQCLRKR